MPKVIGESKRGIAKAEPPRLCAEHMWRKRHPHNEGPEVFLSKRAEEKIRNHAIAYRDEQLEVMGLMVGDAFQAPDGYLYSIVNDVVSSGLEASSVSVRFDRKRLDDLAVRLDDLRWDYLIVGWYHSHPGHGCFLSPTDIQTQRTLFPEPYHSAIVIDPIAMEIAAFKLDGQGYIPVKFAVFWEEYEDPYGPMEKIRDLRPRSHALTS
ncbi:MAG: Mov34/MPN/PAD-1 family protein [Candidatus Thermoplasmatota archaeon]